MMPALLATLGSLAAQPVTIPVDSASPGRIFEGIGAVSAGASSRLLIEYPETQRSEVLDYLFKPRFGASLQHLKVEIGGDVNSTCGCEPSHQHTRDDENYHRGYEWWLMKEARKRRPDIVLDALAWGAPAWVGGFYTQDNADYIVRFYQGAKRVHGLDIQYAGIWNETYYDKEWIKLLRRTFDAAGLNHVRIVAADLVGGPKIWNIVDDMNKDPELARAVHTVGVHYPGYKSPQKALDLGKPLWSSEDGPWKADWPASRRIAKMYNRNYVIGRMTKTLIWSPVTSYYDNLPLPGSGLMKANQPWSGHYVVEPAIWVTAHTTQFAAPGWRYLDTGCVEIDGGSVASMQSPDGRDLTLVIETMDAKTAQELRFQFAVPVDKPLHVWRTNEKEHFVKIAELKPVDSAVTLKVDPDSLYTVSTTTGQSKGAASPPPSQPFPASYKEDFESEDPGATPLRFSDQAGIFETVKRADGKGMSLRQVVPKLGIEWQSHLNPFPETFLGGGEWTDYEVATDALITKAGFVSLFGRVGMIPQNANPPDGYWLRVSDTGDWQLKSIKNPPKKGGKLSETLLARGACGSFAADAWHRIALRFSGERITVIIDGRIAADVADSTFRQGMIGIGCGWHAAEFDNLSVTPEGQDPP
jgi:galactosylceramidase